MNSESGPWSAAPLATLLHEANFDGWESVTAALSQASGLVPPRVAWLTMHLADTKRTYWTLVSGVAGIPTPPDDDLPALMRWEVDTAAALTADQLALDVTHAGRVLSVAALLRLNARHSAWHAGQIAALTRERRA